MCIIFSASADYLVTTPTTGEFTSSHTLETSICITVRVEDDGISDPGEQFIVFINSTNSRVMFTRNTTTVTIIDDDGRCLTFCPQIDALIIYCSFAFSKKLVSHKCNV